MINKYKNAIEHFMSGDRGQRFFNFAYSVGAAIVILGALFKILHMPGGNLLLAIGMGTEVLMFILTAFDRPPRQYNWEEVFPELSGAAESNGKSTEIVSKEKSEAEKVSVAVPELLFPDNLSESASGYLTAMQNVAGELEKLRVTTSALNTLYELQLKSVSSQMSAMENSGKELAVLHTALERSVRQSENLCEEAGKMAENMAKLNSIYAGMISAMIGKKEQ